MTDGWLIVATIAGSAILAKGLGPVLLGGRALPGRLTSGLRLLAPAILATLVVTQLFTVNGSVALDAKLIGFAGGVLAWRLGRGVLVVVLIAAGLTAFFRISGLAAA